ncbi:N-acetylmuramoyl-L-alanine amidase [Streptomyces pacificus]|uniref:N-acetylmuramoyl-L-alanine amidase n=1 Tax=Streptomyces pacificus TaxID=2705029 RepID=A0A6A0AU86_9ACTN|nr:N-acetylmuramoyl-L-alanine amidase [Streptomyces pacificus]GFH35891.1 N-acetylmuramoyl-L-alanine amidase [Streptomyces pacificus]
MKRRRLWGTAATAATAVVGLTGVLVFQQASGGSGGEAGPDAGPGPGPVRAESRTERLTASDDGRSAALAQRGTERFSMLGVTWTDPAARFAGTAEVRTRSVESGRWSHWLRLDGDSGQGERGAVRGGTEPAWVGASNGVEVRVRAGASTTSGLPAGLRLDMVDPGSGKVTAMEPAAFAAEETEQPAPGGTPPDGPETSGAPLPEATPGGEAPTTPPAGEPPVSEPPAPSDPFDPSDPSGSPDPSETPSSSPPPSSPSASGTPSPTATVSMPPAPPSNAPRPPITSRAGWGADESISPEEPGYLPGEKIKAVVVHHTAESNSYTCDQAPAVVRGIYAYHVRQLGWKDLGYNFLVDKCGTVYEGRKGGVDRPVMGAHAYGFNSETTGISVLGTHTDTAPSQAAMVSVARIAAWKLGQYGVDPAGTTTLTAGAAGSNYTRKAWANGAKLSFPVIHGHRDGYNTQCPGNALYAQLATLRSWAGGPVTGLAVKSVTGAGVSGTTYYTKASVTVNWSATTPSSLISKYELLVDGKVAATTAGTATSAKATLAAGTRKVSVRAVHQSGRTTTSAAATVVAETTAPAFPTKPSLALRTGTVNTTAVPLTLSWKATDSASLKEVRLTAPVAKTYGPTTYSAAHTAKSAVATAWKMTAYDRAGNTAAASVTGTPVILQETSAAKSGTWTTKSSTSYLGGKSSSSSSKNASLTWTFTGKSAAWVVSRATGSGQAYVYVDGVKAATVDLKSSTTKYRDAIWTKTWSSSAKHTVKIVVVGTSGRPTVTTDGLVYLK